MLKRAGSCRLIAGRVGLFELHGPSGGLRGLLLAVLLWWWLLPQWCYSSPPNTAEYPHLQGAVRKQPIPLAPRGPLINEPPVESPPIAGEAVVLGGAICLYVLLNLSGRPAPLSDVRRRVATSARGTSMAELQDAADAFGLPVRVLQLAPRQLGSYRCPMILRMGTEDLGEDGHYVVVLHIHAGGAVTLVDGTTAKQVILPGTEFNKLFTGIALIPDRSWAGNISAWTLIAAACAQLTVVVWLVRRPRGSGN